MHIFADTAPQRNATKRPAAPTLSTKRIKAGRKNATEAQCCVLMDSAAASISDQNGLVEKIPKWEKVLIYKLSLYYTNTTKSYNTTTYHNNNNNNNNKKKKKE